jgi:hypothetical protein
MNELSNLLIKNKTNIRSFIVTILKNSDGDEIHSLEGLNKSYRHLVYKCMGNGISFNKVIDDKKGTSIEFFRTNPSVEVFKSITVPRNTASESSSSPGNQTKDSDEDYQDSEEDLDEDSGEDEDSDEDSDSGEDSDEDSDEDYTDNEVNVMDHVVTLNDRITVIYRELSIMLFFLFLINSMILFFFIDKNNPISDFKNY